MRYALLRNCLKRGQTRVCYVPETVFLVGFERFLTLKTRSSGVPATLLRQSLTAEGSYDQAALGKILVLAGMRRFNGKLNDLDPFWEKMSDGYLSDRHLIIHCLSLRY